MPLAVIPDAVKKLPERWLQVVESRRDMTPIDAAADAYERAAKELSAAIKEAEDDGQVLSTSEYAVLRRVAPGTVRKWCVRGELAGAVKNDAGDWDIPATAVRHRTRRSA